VTISAGGSQVYYTVDGSDPRELGGAIQAGLSAYSSALTFNPGRTTVKARAYENGTSTWSAMTEVEFVVDLAEPTAGNLVISELMYHPAAPSSSELAAGFTDQDDFEFVEIMNTSASDTVDLTELNFVDGITFGFGGSNVTELAPGERALVVSNLAAFSARYPGGGHPIAGEYSGGFSNNSEAIALSVSGAVPAMVQSFTYDDEVPWPDCGDGLGNSLVLISPGSNPDHTDPANWTCSTHFGGELNGNPMIYDYAKWADFNFSSAQLLDPGIVGMDEDPDGDGRENLLEFVFGTNPNLTNFEFGGLQISTVQIAGVDYVSIEFSRNSFVSNVSYVVETSSDLAASSWVQLTGGAVEAALPVLLSDGRIRESWTMTMPISNLPRRFFRLKITSF